MRGPFMINTVFDPVLNINSAVAYFYEKLKKKIFMKEDKRLTDMHLKNFLKKLHTEQ
jgi:hypothetical protein